MSLKENDEYREALLEAFTEAVAALIKREERDAAEQHEEMLKHQWMQSLDELSDDEIEGLLDE